MIGGRDKRDRDEELPPRPPVVNGGWHAHSWQGLAVEDHADAKYVIQSCSCGEVRRVRVP